MAHFSARPFFMVGLMAGMGVLWAGLALAQTPPEILEPGQTPRPKPEGPVVMPSEADSVKLDPTLPQRFAVADDAPFRFRGKELSHKATFEANDELAAYEYTILTAARHSPELLKKYAKKNVSWSYLFGEVRQDYLWELLHFEGKLIYLQPFKSTEGLQNSPTAPKELYEAWIYPKGATELVCLVTIDKPAGIEPGENLNHWVSFDAYYFKFMRYESRQVKAKDAGSDETKHQWRRAPLFVGRTFEVLPIQEAELSFFSGTMFFTVVGGLLVLIGVGAALSYWFRRGDKAIKDASLRRIQEGVRFDVEPDETKPAPVDPGAGS